MSHSYKTLVWMNLKSLHLHKRKVTEESTEYESIHIYLENSNTKNGKIN